MTPHSHFISPRARPRVPARLGEPDLRILAELSRDGRILFSRLAEKLGVPRTARELQAP